MQTVEGLAGVVPTVTISQHTGLAQVTIRGIGTNSTSSAIQVPRFISTASISDVPRWCLPIF